MVATHPHPWLLGGPWYRWPRPGLPADGRLSVPEIQKYGHAQFVKAFLAAPHRSLRWDAEADYVHEAGFLNPGASLVNRVAGFTESVKGWMGRDANTEVLFRRDLYNARMTPTGLLKLFLPVHERFYLVVAELHCDTGGFPAVSPEQVCQAGFVIRRRHTPIAREDLDKFRNLAAAVRTARAELSEILADSSVKPLVDKARLASIASLKAQGFYGDELATRQDEFAAARERLDDWLTDAGYSTNLERWVACDPSDPAAKVGRWSIIRSADAEQLVDADGLPEHVVPMRRAFAPTDDAQHDAAGRALYFGVIPTSALQHDSGGNDRFDDSAVYEIRCFVRHRRTDCLRIPGFAACRGELTWSRATQPYSIASPGDLYGAANRPVTIRMPDLEVMRAQIATAPPGRFSSTAFVQPQQLTTSEDGMPKTRTQPGAAAICFFAIPLIMIVALFILNLFLPIILFVFQLWWMLALKFCLPPKVSIDAGLAAALDGKFPSASVEADISASFEVEVPTLGVIDEVAVGNLIDGRLGEMAMRPTRIQEKVLLAIASRKLPTAEPQFNYLADDYYPPVTPVWTARPMGLLEGQP